MRVSDRNVQYDEKLHCHIHRSKECHSELLAFEYYVKVIS